MTVTTFHLFRRSNLFRNSTKNPKGTGYDLKNNVKNIVWTTDMNLSAGELTFDLIEPLDQLVIPYTGDIITFRWNKEKVFYGYVFKYEFTGDRTISVTCYDKLRYLKNEDSIVFKTNTVADRFNEVCKRAGLSHSVKNAPTHKVAAEICDGKTYFDMLKTAINKTYQSTDHMYFVAANYDKVELRRAPYKKLKIVVDTRTVVTDFTYSVDIENTANVVKVVQKDKKKSQTSSATAKGNSDKETPSNTSFSSTSAQGKSVEQWGKLQIVKPKKSKATQAQMMAQAKSVLKQKNVANKKLSITTKGDLSLVAGNAVTVYLKDMKKKLSDCPILKATHEFGTDYMVKLEMKVGKQWQESKS
ncbi:hypothetical protein GCM10022297_01060 [Lactobacillus hamsteri]|uniref:YqbQ/XkdQ domain-containing protein n=1 Tax=Lactobacillus hamsteri DSM 5661 = JCM 6256 TaxID=1423754 RepID=A0A0R1Y8R2_9LACO|nr:hypothetical protein [Lactobacillus hamsteri]KRM36996.1 hypothetical protein FC39_GL000448 [Lactobacillus hamsteri DSM 5661 = JCM 6256]